MHNEVTPASLLTVEEQCSTRSDRVIYNFTSLSSLIITMTIVTREIGNITPADIYFGRDYAIIEKRRKVKNPTIKNRRV